MNQLLSFLKSLFNKQLFYDAVANGLSESWFSDSNVRYFLKFLNMCHENNVINIENYFLQLANLYINDDDERSKFLNFFDEILSSSENNEFYAYFHLLKQQYLSETLIKQINPLLSSLKTANYDKAISIIQKLSLETSSLVSERYVYDIRDSSIHDQSLLISNGVEVGYPSIDNATKGFKPGQLVILVSGPGEGKSTFLLNMAYNAFMRGKNIVFFSCEMPMVECVKRFDSLHLKIPFSKLDNNLLTDEERSLYITKKEELRKMSNYFKIVDQNHPSISDIESEIVKLDIKPDLVVVDYLALVSSIGTYKNKWESLDNVTVHLRRLARKYEFPLLTAAQVNRDAMSTKQEFYKSHHISGSISLLHHCDIMIATRIDDPDALKAAPICSLNVIFWKNRNGQCPSFVLGVDFSKFYIWEFEGVQI